MPPAKQIRQGKVVDVPFVLGTNIDETSYYTPTGINTELDLFDAVTATFSCNTSQALAIMDHYSISDPEITVLGVENYQLNDTVGHLFKRANSIGTDLIYTASTHYTAQLWAQQANLSSNIYIFSANTTIAQGPVYYGAAHGFELAYMFYNLNGTGWEGTNPPFNGGNPFADRPQPYFELAEVMSGMWIGFINSGKPHYENRTYQTFST
jgi:triacylglycerol lipase